MVKYSQKNRKRAMKYLLSFFISALIISGCQNDPQQHAALMPGTKPAVRYNPHGDTQTLNPTDEQIRLLKAQTDAKARLAEIEARKAERLKKLEAQRAMTVARIESEKAGKLKRLEVEQTKNTNAAQAQMAQAKASADIVREKERQKTALVRQKETIAFYRQLLIAGVIILFLLMLLIYLLYRHRQSLKAKLHDDQLRHQAYLEANRHHHEKVTKLLEIIADEGTDKNLRKELTKLLKEQGGEMPKLIEGR